MEIPSPFKERARERILLKNSLLPESYMAQEKGLSILISLPISDHLLIYERDLMPMNAVAA